MKLATNFYTEYLEYKDNKEPAEEYELILHWAKDLKLENYFELVDEIEYRTKHLDITNFLVPIEKDQYDLESKISIKEKEMETFKKSQQILGTNVEVIMFIIDALKYFETMSKESIKKIAFDIAMAGTQGFKPDRGDYQINSIKGKIFSGYSILAYYYVSWMLAIPEMVAQLNLSYNKEYEFAQMMYKSAS